MARRSSVLVFLVSALLVLALFPFMLSLGLLTGIGFAVSVAIALWRGVLWRDKTAVVWIAIGYALVTFSARLLLPIAWVRWQQQSFIVALGLLATFLLIFWRAQRFKRGRR